MEVVQSVGLEGAVPVKKGKTRSPTDEAIKRFGVSDRTGVRLYGSGI